ncbi:hypothetical protein ACOACO_17035 [Nocardioides sp. CPCC 205120]|uniref:hypothetical protein n=1 Tax=Nocardioides sp. CPCC 205120 TaxID=3406462 RepID=UPI003B50B78F
MTADQPRVPAAQAVRDLGGVARWADLRPRVTRHALREAVRRGELSRCDHGRYRVAEADEALVLARRIGGVASHLSAAVLHGWEVARPPTDAWFTVPRGSRRRDVWTPHTYRADLVDEPDDVTRPLRTVLDCARRLPFEEALAVADSALRHGDVEPLELRIATERVGGRGAGQLRRVAAHADGRAANPFESVLRAHALEVGLDAVAQLAVRVEGRVLHPDVGDAGRRLAVEAESWAYHGDADAFRSDCWRHTVLAVAGWRVLRFTWQQVMHDGAWVRRCLAAFA